MKNKKNQKQTKKTWKAPNLYDLDTNDTMGGGGFPSVLEGGHGASMGVTSTTFTTPAVTMSARAAAS